MTYTEEVQARVGKITEDIAMAWLDLRMEVGEDDLADVWTDLEKRRAELIEKSADIINELEGIDRELKERADSKAEQEAAAQRAVDSWEQMLHAARTASAFWDPPAMRPWAPSYRVHL